jgi:hypothetical protein
MNNDYNVYLPSVLIANVRSLSGKVDELSVIANINDIDIICITESWLTDTIPDSTVSLPNFNMFRNNRTSSVGGGVCAYYALQIVAQILKTGMEAYFVINTLNNENKS